MNTLVTGGAGFIGSNLVDALLARGDTVHIVDDLSTGARANVADAATLHEGSITDPDHLAAAFAAAQPDVVFHLGAQIDVRRSVADPVFDATVNVGGTVRVADAALAAGARMVFASTGGAIYGDTDIVPSPESTPERPMAPYGQAKLAAEHYLALYGRLHELPATVLRFANVYGPRQDPLGEGGVIAIFCGLAGAGAGARPATVFGDGEQTRDFVYVGDVVDSMLAAAAPDAPFGPFNVGTGVETTVNALAAALELPVRSAPARPGEVRRSCLDPSAAATALGWTPRTPLADGLKRTLAWARARDAVWAGPAAP